MFDGCNYSYIYRNQYMMKAISIIDNDATVSNKLMLNVKKYDKKIRELDIKNCSRHKNRTVNMLLLFCI